LLNFLLFYRQIELERLVLNTDRKPRDVIALIGREHELSKLKLSVNRLNFRISIHR